MNTAEQWQQTTEYGRQVHAGDSLKVHQKSRKPRSGRGMDAGRKKSILLFMVLVGLICIGVIIASAYAAAINYQNNQLKESNKALQGEVESLQIEIKSANNIARIEKKATKELGMVYPTGKQLVKISGKQDTGRNFAGNLKKDVLN